MGQHRLTTRLLNSILLSGRIVFYSNDELKIMQVHVGKELESKRRAGPRAPLGRERQTAPAKYIQEDFRAAMGSTPISPAGMQRLEVTRVHRMDVTQVVCVVC